MMVNQDFCEQYHSQKTIGSFLLFSFPDSASLSGNTTKYHPISSLGVMIFVCGVFQNEGSRPRGTTTVLLKQLLL